MQPHRKEQWVIPPEANGEFVAHMEDLLEVYHRPYDERRPLVCLDQVPVQRVGETRVPLPPVSLSPPSLPYSEADTGTDVASVIVSLPAK